MNMFKEVKAKSFKEYIEVLPEDRKKIMLFLDKFIRKSAPSLKPYFSANMPGYGKFKYTNYKRVEGFWPVIAIASQKNYISIYVCSIVDGKYVAEAHKNELGKVSVGKSCIRFRRIEELNLLGFEKILKIASKKPGLIAGN